MDQERINFLRRTPAGCMVLGWAYYNEAFCAVANDDSRCLAAALHFINSPNSDGRVARWGEYLGDFIPDRRIATNSVPLPILFHFPAGRMILEAVKVNRPLIHGCCSHESALELCFKFISGDLRHWHEYLKLCDVRAQEVANAQS